LAELKVRATRADNRLSKVDAESRTLRLIVSEQVTAA